MRAAITQLPSLLKFLHFSPLLHYSLVCSIYFFLWEYPFCSPWDLFDHIRCNSKTFLITSVFQISSSLLQNFFIFRKIISIIVLVYFSFYKRQRSYLLPVMVPFFWGVYRKLLAFLWSKCSQTFCIVLALASNGM